MPKKTMMCDARVPYKLPAMLFPRGTIGPFLDSEACQREATLKVMTMGFTFYRCAEHAKELNSACDKTIESIKRAKDKKRRKNQKTGGRTKYSHAKPAQKYYCHNITRSSHA